MSTKQQREQFRKGAEEIIRQYGGRKFTKRVPHQDAPYWVVETPYGRLQLEISDYELLGRRCKTKSIGTVFGRFEEVERAKQHTYCNPYSGKWNHHYFEPSSTVEDALANFDAAMQLLMESDDTDEDDTDEKANAGLVSAAPTMLYALQRARDALSAIRDGLGGRDLRHGCQVILEIIDHATKQATSTGG